MKKFFFATLLTLLLTMPGHGQLFAAEGAWQWELTLQETKDNSVMDLPTSVSVDPELERYYVVDSGNIRLLTYDRRGDFYRAFDAGNQMQTPFDLAREKDILWLVEKNKNSLTRIDLEAKKISLKTLSDQGHSVFPDRLELANNTLYLLNKAKGNILGLDSQLQVTGRFSCGRCEGGFVDFKIRDGSLWALEQESARVYRFSLTGALQETIQLEKAAVDFPRSLAVDENGFLFILDRHRGNVAVFDANGGFRYRFLEHGRARGQLYYPIEIRFDPWGRLCVVDEGNGRVQIFSRR